MMVDGSRQEYARLEMPKLLFQNGQPTVLSLAALPKGGDESFLVIVPLLAHPGTNAPSLK